MDRAHDQRIAAMFDRIAPAIEAIHAAEG